MIPVTVFVPASGELVLFTETKFRESWDIFNWGRRRHWVLCRSWSEPLVRENHDKISRGMAVKEKRHGDTSRRKSYASILHSVDVSAREDESDDCFKEPFRLGLRGIRQWQIGGRVRKEDGGNVEHAEDQFPELPSTCVWPLGSRERLGRCR
jgi:hypothetical protein